MVSLLVRLWVEIWITLQKSCTMMSASSWGCELKYKSNNAAIIIAMSASSWGCELKWHWRSVRKAADGQPPREAVSWNSIYYESIWCRCCQPPREAVSWNVLASSGRFWISVSLLVRLWVEMLPTQISVTNDSPSASSWGCELKYKRNWIYFRWDIVSLLVRLWVEIQSQPGRGVHETSQPPREAVSWNVPAAAVRTVMQVSLLVRLWVEIA